MRSILRRFNERIALYWANGSGVKAAILATCLLSTTSAFFAGTRAEQRLAEAVASETAIELAADIEQSFKSYETLLQSISYIAGLVPTLDEKSFRKYVRNFDLLKSFEGLYGIGWSIKETSASDKPSPKDQHSIIFIEPMNERNARAIGYNMFSEPTRRKAMLDASERGKITASDAITLVQEKIGDEQAGLLLYAPVFNGNANSGYGNLRGFIYGIVRVESMVKTVLPRKMRATGEFALFDSANASSKPAFKTAKFNTSSNPNLSTTNISVAGKTWTLALDQNSITSQSGLIPFSYYVLAAGLVLSAVIYLLTASVYARRAQVQQSLAAAQEQNRIRSVLVKELNHRVKNSLATVLSLASLSRRHASDIDSYYEGFSARVAALAGTHDILTRSDWHDASIHEIIKAELGAHTSEKEERLSLSGPDLELKPSAALTLGLAIHELATNAAKYGAMSTDNGCVKITWALDDSDQKKPIVDFRWSESGGPVVETPTSQGFGTLLLTRLTARELGGVVEIDYAPSGLSAHITLDWKKTQATDISSDFKN